VLTRADEEGARGGAGGESDDRAHARDRSKKRTAGRARAATPAVG
jgi:hypothetical protein